MTRLARMNMAAEEFRSLDPKDWGTVIEQLRAKGMPQRDIELARLDALPASCQHKEIEHRAMLDGPPGIFDLWLKCKACGAVGRAALLHDHVEW